MTDARRQELITHAKRAMKAAYAPYSNYHVGAALQDTAGRIHVGCNVENASYGLTICAERTCLFKAVSEGMRQFLAIAIATRDGGTPCGACRQCLAEFCGSDLPVILYNQETDTTDTYTLGALLPHAFG